MLQCASELCNLHMRVVCALCWTLEPHLRWHDPFLGPTVASSCGPTVSVLLCCCCSPSRDDNRAGSTRIYSSRIHTRETKLNPYPHTHKRLWVWICIHTRTRRVSAIQWIPVTRPPTTILALNTKQQFYYISK